MRRLFNQAGQSTLEYALVVAVIVGALLAMQIYMKRGVEGRLRGAADDIGGQYEPGQTESKWTTESSSTTVEETTAGITSSYLGAEGKGAAVVTEKSGYEKVSAW